MRVASHQILNELAADAACADDQNFDGGEVGSGELLGARHPCGGRLVACTLHPSIGRRGLSAARVEFAVPRRRPTSEMLLTVAQSCCCSLLLNPKGRWSHERPIVIMEKRRRDCRHLSEAGRLRKLQALFFISSSDPTSLPNFLFRFFLPINGTRPWLGPCRRAITARWMRGERPGEPGSCRG